MDGSDTFGTYIGESHFHIACRLCPETLDIVEKYLKQGISANLQTKQYSKNKEYLCYEEFIYDLGPAGKSGLHITGMTYIVPCLN